ncbi:MAG: hypothetical protein ACOCYE_09445 [Pseudomonadota bacterium]
MKSETPYTFREARHQRRERYAVRDLARELGADMAALDAAAASDAIDATAAHNLDLARAVDSTTPVRFIDDARG